MPLAPIRGSITLELVIAFAVFSIALASLSLVARGTPLSREADELSIAEEEVGTAFAKSFPLASATSSVSRGESRYEVSRAVRDLTPCAESFIVSVGTGTPALSLFALRTNPRAYAALGGDCEAHAVAGAWNHASDAVLATENATAADALGSLIYTAISVPPYFAITAADGADVPFQNGFAPPAAPAAIDAAMIGAGRYVFAALDATSSQFAVIDATDPANPSLAALRTLSGVDPYGSYPEGYRVRYFGERAYVLTRETSGPELHVFDASDPSDPHELGTGTELGSTANDILLFEREGKRYAFLATSRDSRELALYDASDSGAFTELTSARTDLPGGQDGERLALLGTTLYLGRASNTAGPELYSFDVKDAPSAPAILGTGEVGSKDVSGIVADGSLLFITATLDAPSTRRIEIWNAEDPKHLARIIEIPLPGLAPGGIDAWGDLLYAATSDGLRSFSSE